MKESGTKQKTGEVRLTRQRRLVMEVLEQNRGSHLTAEEIFMEARKIMPGIGLATVYRTLELLSRMDILRKGEFKDGVRHYELLEKDRHFHHHFECLKCGSVVEIEEDLLQNLEEELERKGYKVTDHVLMLYGECPRCRGRDKQQGS